MGLFSSKKEYHVSTSVVRIVEDEHIPNARKTVPLTSIFEGTDITDDFVRYGINGGFRNFEKMYRYALRGSYIHGLPNTQLLSSSSARDSVQAAIEKDIGLPVTVTYSHFLPLNNVHMGWKTCYESYGYDKHTNELKLLSGAKGTPVYLDNIIARHNIEVGYEPEAGSLQRFNGCDNPTQGYTPERPSQENGELSQVAADEIWYEGPDEVESVEIHYIWETDEGIQKDFITVDLSGYSANDEYYQARYTYKVGNQTLVGYWFYDIARKIHTDLDNHYDLTRSTPGTYFPFIIFIHDGLAITQSNKSSLEYTSTNKMMNYIGLDFGDVGDAIHEEDLSDIEQAVMMMGVPMDTSEPVELAYLHRFFQRVYNQTRSQTSTSGTQYAISFADADFKLVLSFRGIKSSMRAGNIGSIGDVTLSRESLDTILGEDSTGEELDASAQRSTRGRQDIYYYRLQVSANVIQELAVDSPRFRYEIYKGESVGGGADSDKMLVPIDYELVKHLSYLDKERLYYRSMHFVFNTLVITKSKWYESKWMKTVLTVAAIIMAIPTGGQSLSWAAVLAAVTTVAGLTALVVNLVILPYLVNITFEVLAENFGVDFAIFVAVAASIYAGSVRLSGGTTKGTLPDYALQFASNLPNASYLKDKTEEIMLEIAEFDTLAEERMDELNELSEELTPQNLIDPTVFVDRGPITIFGESPDEFYNRTIHAGNVGITSYKIIENFVENSLKLPDIDETLEKMA